MGGPEQSLFVSDTCPWKRRGRLGGLGKQSMRLLPQSVLLLALFSRFIFSSRALQPALFSLNLLQLVPSWALTPGHSDHYLTELPSVLYLLTHPRHVASELLLALEAQ